MNNLNVINEIDMDTQIHKYAYATCKHRYTKKSNLKSE